jgi:clan AA aspartic protease (TIGR02281 family)
MKNVLCLSVFILAIAHSAAVSGAEYYRWVDDKGNVHFTDNMYNVPDKSRVNMDRYWAPENKTPPPPPPKTKASVPFEKQGSVVVVDATLNRTTTARLVVDTGASYTLISNATAKELNLDAGNNPRTVPFQTANGTIQAPLVSLDSITVGGIEVRNLTAAIHDIGVESKVAGLLGLDFLSNFRMDIDTQKGVLILEKK